jgi:MFS family permease
MSIGAVSFASNEKGVLYEKNRISNKKRYCHGFCIFAQAGNNCVRCGIFRLPGNFYETFLNVAFSSIMADLGVGISSVQWLATAYMLGAAVMVPVSAFLYRSVPTRHLYLITVGLLVAGSVIGALSLSFPMLLAGRIVQALGTGMLIKRWSA